MANDQIDDGCDRFVSFGGVPRFVLWDGIGCNPLKELRSAMESSEGSTVIQYFFCDGFGKANSEKSCLLTHLNPPWLPERDDWDYLNGRVHSFASDEILRTLPRRYASDLLRQAKDVFNTGRASLVHEGGSANNLFEKVVLWLKPIAGQTITWKSLTDGTELVLPLPAAELLPRHWKANTNGDGGLYPGRLYQPRISTLESGDCDCFGVVEHDAAYVLLGLQMTVSETHPIIANGLKDIVRAYPLDVQSRLSKKLVGFVTPVNGCLLSMQPIHTRDGSVMEQLPTEVEGFEQYVCEYNL